MKIFSLISLFLFSLNSYAVKKSKENYRQKVKELKDGLQLKKNKIIKLDAAITSLEKDLGKKNNVYLSNIKKIQTIENELTLTTNALKDSEASSRGLLKKSKQLFNHLILNSLNEEGDLLEREVLKKVFESRVNELKFTLKNYKEIQGKIDFLRSKLQDFKENEKQLYEIILTLENRKKTISQDVAANIFVKDKLESNLSIVQFELKKESKENKKKRLFKLSLPLTSFKNAKLSKKGLSIVPKKKRRLKATGKGKIVYSGQLSTYGNLIIIEHEKELRSVILGQFVPIKKKGDLVKKGEFIGRIIDIKKEVYFEIRKKNKAQKISRWLERKSLNRVL